MPQQDRPEYGKKKGDLAMERGKKGFVLRGQGQQSSRGGGKGKRKKTGFSSREQKIGKGEESNLGERTEPSKKKGKQLGEGESALLVLVISDVMNGIAEKPMENLKRIIAKNTRGNRRGQARKGPARPTRKTETLKKQKDAGVIEKKTR